MKREGIDESSSSTKRAKESALLEPNTWHIIKNDALMVKLAPTPTSKITTGTVEGKMKVFAFDMDGCIIETKSGNSFAKDKNDWRFFHDSPFKKSPVPDRLKSFHEDGYIIAFISNQGGIKEGRVSALDLQEKIDKILLSLGIPIHVICCIGEKYDIHRKPRPGAWNFLVSQITRSTNQIDLVQCKFVGDAAGRPAGINKKKRDFADTDYKLALNVGIAFATPEQVFLDSTSPLHCDLPTPSFSIKSYLDKQEPDPQLFTELCGSPEIVLLVAPAASGKSTLTRKFASHVRCNSDDLGGIDKCMTFAREALTDQERKSVVIDNTNVFSEPRQKWIALAKDLDVPIRAIFIEVEKDLNKHLSIFRMLSKHTEQKDRRYIDDRVLNMHYTPYEKTPPLLGHGFSRIDTIQFVPMKYEDKETNDLFMTFLF